MIGTDALRRQHDEAEEMAAAIIDRMQRYRHSYDALLIARLVAKLNALLRVHLACEDTALYPAMIRGGDAEASLMAARFHEEMGGLAEQFEDFARRWSSAAAIGAMFEDFREEAVAILAALAARIERENDLLYPVAQRTLARAAA